jgi:plastocyanin
MTNRHVSPPVLESPVSLRVAMIVPLLAFGLAACGGTATSEPPAPPATAASGSGSSGSAGAASASPTASAADVVEIRVTVSGGRVEPGPSVHKVAKGRTVRIVVTSDKDDELHVHGYDLETKITAGRPATVEFTADQAGRFEVETHESGLQLLQLQVS